MPAPAAPNPMPLRPHASPGSSLSHATPSSCQPQQHLMPTQSVLMPAPAAPNPMQLVLMPAPASPNPMPLRPHASPGST
ncbi:hypothetical protein RRG08_030231 [Elysia crispata]|uniref:Uncharacterized protein n=1 Tax=Elysia crispata TaxID=231223 RepID=A0AAE1AJB3_9GAST|nr:hypothetical protein RRG08_030231 [Elysia crispata]